MTRINLLLIIVMLLVAACSVTIIIDPPPVDGLDPTPTREELEDPPTLPPTATFTATPAPTVTITATSSVNVRNGPGTGFSIVTQVTPGTVLELVSVSGDWYEVWLPVGRSGWIASWLAERN